MDNFYQFTYSNSNSLKIRPKGVIVDFYGLNYGYTITGIKKKVCFALANDWLYLIPYYNPWSWMNNIAVKMIDEILSAVFKYYQLNNDTSVAFIGESMGGLGTLIYSIYGKFKPILCISICPVCDLPEHIYEQPSVIKTLYSSFYHYDCSFHEALISCSPIHQISQLPSISYLLIHGENDKKVNINMHTDKLSERMLKAGYDVQYYRIPQRGHCELDEEAINKIKINLCTKLI